MIVCGWCGVPTRAPWCVNCRRDPTLPYVQRAQTPVPVDPYADERRKLAEAERAIPGGTIETHAAYLDVSPRTVRRWREVTR